MTSFAQTLRLFSTGSISRDDLFSSLENILSQNRVDTPWLLSVLDQEQKSVSLPQEIYDEVRLKVISATDNAMNSLKSNSVPQSYSVEQDDADLSRTQIATSFIQPVTEDDDESTDLDSPSGLLSSSFLTSEPEIKGVGDVLNGRFVLEERVGTGGMSTVYRALDRRKLEADDRDPYIAVKILNVEFRSHPDSLVALQREAKKCHKLAHPNIVRAYDFDRDQATVYMTMEYLTGHSLANILRDPGFKGMPCDQAMPIIEGMTKALAYAHNNGIIHADFKPANVILTDNGEVKVIDFGIARAFHKQGENETEATRFDPGSLGALTPTYASPEMLEHRDPDPRDDVYALACIVYELLTGRHPFGRRQANEARDGGFTLNRSTLTRRQWKALKSALAFDRDKRTASIEQFYKEINPECARITGLGLIPSLLLVLLVAIGIIVFQNNVSLFNSSESDGTTQQQIVSSKPVAESVTHADMPKATEKQTEKIKPAERADEKEEAVAVVKTGKSEVVIKPSVATTQKPALSDKEILRSIRNQLLAYDCSAMTASIKGDEVRVTGFANESIPITKLKRDLLPPSGGKSLAIDVEPLKKSMCDLVDLYRPYWIRNAENGLGTSIRPKSTNAEFKGGEPLVVKLTTPGYGSFVSVDYYSLDGHVVHMLPSQHVRGNQAPANYSATLGDLGQWIVSEPYGRELIVILTTPTPLFSGLRKEYETASDYMKALNARLSSISKESDRQQITADFVFIQTRAKF